MLRFLLLLHCFLLGLLFSLLILGGGLLLGLSLLSFRVGFLLLGLLLGLLLVDDFLLLLLLSYLGGGLLDAGWLLAFSLLRVVAAGDGQHCAGCNGQHDQRWGEDA